MSIRIQKKSVKSPTRSRIPFYDAAVTYALDRLERELPINLYYHNLWHTRNEVIPISTFLAVKSGLGEESTNLVRIASAFHDLGISIRYNGHEQISSEIAYQVLPAYGFSPDQISSVIGMIMATRLPQTPYNLLEQIVADADLDVLGRSDFWQRNILLRQEREVYCCTVEELTWYSQQLNFLEGHHYFTLAAKILRDDGQRGNIQRIKAHLAC
ncbi:MAG: phosphohydrolase [Omnitrophica WOR_2 bacterium]